MADKKGEASKTSVIEGLEMGGTVNTVLKSVEANDCHLDIDVFVPLYANTFPISILFNELGRKTDLIDISLHDYDWDWSWQDNSKPRDKQLNTTPFESNSDYQMLFATSAEFDKISRAGISFIPIPTTIFNPKYLFIGSKINCRDSHIAAKELCMLLKNRTGLTAKETHFHEELCSLSDEGEWIDDIDESKLGEIAEKLKKTNFVWVTDIPDQAAPIKNLFEEVIGLNSDNSDGIRNWTDRTLSEVLNSEYEKEDRKEDRPTVKIYLWGGPLAAKARFDIKWCEDLNCQCHENAQKKYGDANRKLRIPYLRDSNRPTYAFEIPKISTIATSAKSIKSDSEDFIANCQDRYITYCCIGYRETSKFNSYYKTRIKELEDHRNDMALGEDELLQRMGYALDNDSILKGLCQIVDQFYNRIFEYAEDAENLSPDEVPWLESIRLKYDKYCRTKNPVAQFQQFEEFRSCLVRHHEAPERKYFS